MVCVTPFSTVGAQTTIPRLEPDEACHTLGVQIAPHGNVKVDLEYLKTVACQWQTEMASSQLS